MKIEEISKHNLKELVLLMMELWPQSPFDEELQNCQDIMATEDQTCFLVNQQGEYIAFIQLALRYDYVEGTVTSPVAYIEGIYVKPRDRKSGIARELVELGEKWAKEKGCTQFASDTEIGNSQSIRFHKKVGFKEVNRLVSFLKDIK